jgi:hypothetical protein
MDNGTNATKKSFLNWINRIPPTPSYINGPFSLRKFTHKPSIINGWTNDFCVYVFGEYHNSTGCKDWNDYLPSDKKMDERDVNEAMDIDDFLWRMANDSPVFLDIFIEMQRGESDVINYFFNDQFINKIRATFDSYIMYIDEEKSIDNKKIREENRIQNLRVHAIDERERHTGGFLSAYYNVLFDKETLFTCSDVRDMFIKDVEEAVNTPEDKIFDKFYLSDPFVKKEFNKISKEHQGRIKRLIFHKKGKVLISFRHAKSYFEYWSKHTNYDVRNLYENISHEEVRIMSSHVDVYFMARFLKGFSTNLFDHPSFPYNSIVYAGDAHASIYREFFLGIGFKEENMIINDVLYSDVLHHDVDVAHIDRDSDGKFFARASNCLHVDKKRMYPMFGVKSCGNKNWQL